MKKVCVMGLGYIGLPTSSLLASKGFKVHGVDINPKVVETINRGEIHIHEPDLDILVKSVVSSGNLRASLQPVPADVYIIATPTPLKDDWIPDISYIEAATEAIAPYLAPNNLVILESTSPVGTTEKIGHWLEQLRPDLDVHSSLYLAHCPERVLPGQILKELVSNDRIVGGINQASANKAAAFYRQFVTGKILCTEVRTAELAKLTENAFRDVNIAFANELSLICEKLNINVWELIELANHHPRVNILQPGPGVGGHCIPVDPWFIVNSAPEQARLIRTAREVNDAKLHHVIAKIKEKACQFKEPMIACLGLTFKADVDDLRESPAVSIVQKLAQSQFGGILVVEPHIRQLPQSLAKLSVTLTNFEIALSAANIVVLLVNHSQFVNLNRERLKDKIVIDTRGIWQ
ncbi:UDP-N-acetyl-D-mannosamine dehydrogenase [Trichocoleus sp. FACHB-90]|uniref:UDP-N-acetyl-D-mannosamine dehydrogenase n=1 Tax=Cyanophyceae TaxID=3028117 RepID=UPI001685B2BD|nr:UDP-N-acetyl-D-mannosamine dehydrogenase [Trichocoleus sp. FACHB-90]MBD1924883.1 UDP-N-acetyl-D-mannosamine dehydrogenase [Trichocoleus sp. FACHB-90]